MAFRSWHWNWKPAQAPEKPGKPFGTSGGKAYLAKESARKRKELLKRVEPIADPEGATASRELVHMQEAAKDLDTLEAKAFEAELLRWVLDPPVGDEGWVQGRGRPMDKFFPFHVDYDMPEDGDPSKAEMHPLAFEDGSFDRRHAGEPIPGRNYLTRLTAVKGLPQLVQRLSQRYRKDMLEKKKLLCGLGLELEENRDFERYEERLQRAADDLEQGEVFEGIRDARPPTQRVKSMTPMIRTLADLTAYFRLIKEFDGDDDENLLLIVAPETLPETKRKYHFFHWLEDHGFEEEKPPDGPGPAPPEEGDEEGEGGSGEARGPSAEQMQRAVARARQAGEREGATRALDRFRGEREELERRVRDTQARLDAMRQADAAISPSDFQALEDQYRTALQMQEQQQRAHAESTRGLEATIAQLQDTIRQTQSQAGVQHLAGEREALEDERRKVAELERRIEEMGGQSAATIASMRATIAEREARLDDAERFVVDARQAEERERAAKKEAHRKATVLAEQVREKEELMAAMERRNAETLHKWKTEREENAKVVQELLSKIGDPDDEAGPAPPEDDTVIVAAASVEAYAKQIEDAESRASDALRGLEQAKADAHAKEQELLRMQERLKGVTEEAQRSQERIQGEAEREMHDLLQVIAQSQQDAGQMAEQLRMQHKELEALQALQAAMTADTSMDQGGPSDQPPPAAGAAAATIAGLEERIVDMSRRMEEMREQARSATEGSNQMRLQAQLAQAEHQSELVRLRHELGSEIEGLRTELAGRSTEVRNQQRDLDQQERDLDATRQQKAAVETQLGAANAQLDVLNGRIAELQAQGGEALRAATEARDAALGQKTALEAELGTKNAELATASQALETARGQITAAQTSERDARRRLVLAEQGLAGAAEVKEKLTRAEGVVATLHEAVERLVGEKEALESRAGEASQYRATAASLEAQLAAKQTEHSRAAAEVARLREVSQRYKLETEEKIQKVQQDLTASDNMRRGYQERTSALENEIAGLKARTTSQLREARQQVAAANDAKERAYAARQEARVAASKAHDLATTTVEDSARQLEQARETTRVALAAKGAAESTLASLQGSSASHSEALSAARAELATEREKSASFRERASSAEDRIQGIWTTLSQVMGSETQSAEVMIGDIIRNYRRAHTEIEGLQKANDALAAKADVSEERLAAQRNLTAHLIREVEGLGVAFGVAGEFSDEEMQTMLSSLSTPEEVRRRMDTMKETLHQEIGKREEAELETQLAVRALHATNAVSNSIANEQARQAEEVHEKAMASIAAVQEQHVGPGGYAETQVAQHWLGVVRNAIGHIPGMMMGSVAGDVAKAVSEIARGTAPMEALEETLRTIGLNLSPTATQTLPLLPGEMQQKLLAAGRALVRNQDRERVGSGAPLSNAMVTAAQTIMELVPELPNYLASQVGDPQWETVMIEFAGYSMWAASGNMRPEVGSARTPLTIEQLTASPGEDVAWNEEIQSMSESMSESTDASGYTGPRIVPPPESDELVAAGGAVARGEMSMDDLVSHMGVGRVAKGAFYILHPVMRAQAHVGPQIHAGHAAQEAQALAMSTLGTSPAEQIATEALRAADVADSSGVDQVIEGETQTLQEAVDTAGIPSLTGGSVSGGSSVGIDVSGANIQGYGGPRVVHIQSGPKKLADVYDDETVYNIHNRSRRLMAHRLRLIRPELPALPAIPTA